MKILIFGASGMLGHKLFQVLNKRFDVWATLRTDFNIYEWAAIFDKKKIVENLDIENTDAVESVIKNLKPNVIINAVGVIKQSPTAKNLIKTLTVNSIFPHQLSEFARAVEARLITVSTDCVFSGKKGKYRETDISDALDLYGKSKFLGEVTGESCLTLRTSIIGRELTSKHSLLEWFLSNKGKTVSGYTQAVFSGFPTIILTEIISELIENHPNLQGLFHVSGEPISKYELLRLMRKAYRADINVEPSDDLKIDRSLDSAKFREATGFRPLEWEEMIERMAADNQIYLRH